MGFRLPIKIKTAIALSVPLGMMVAVAGLEVVQSSREVREMREQTDLATAAIGPSGLITAIQNERNFTGLWLLGSETLVNLPVNDMEQARAATDQAYRAFRDEVARKGGDVARTYGPALEALEGEHGLAAQRRLVDSYTGPRLVTQYNATADRSFNGYTLLVGALADPTTRLTSSIEDEELRRGVQLIDMASRELDRIARFVRLALLQAVRGDGRIAGREEVQEASLAQSEGDRAHLQIVELASHGRYRALGEELEVESEETQVRQIMRQIVRTGEIPVDALLAGISISDDESYYGFLHDVSEVLRDRADELNAAALARQRRFLTVAAIVLVVALVVMPLATRSITRPLRSLTRQAVDLARRRLPEAVRRVQETPLGQDVAPPELEPVTVPASDEVADVADMLTRVQATAIDLAVGQAVLRRNVADALVNLARRNQNLLGRQLTFITELEAHETSPETLGNLFRLDHLATRMRRNAESLLVLAGVEQQRHATAPAPLVDVIRAALGEVDEFHRVSFPAVQPVTIDGPAVADLAHLLAELIENALRFSPPEVPVDIRGHSYLAEDAYLVSIIDQGTGMSAEEIERANRRLAQAEDFTVAPSRYLGHYVTAALAARHGIKVTLVPTMPSADHPGITARVQLPNRLLVRGARPPFGAGPRRSDRITV
ncbi:MAG TPA: ATP-binding protein [Acidimicrobiales bacterium]